MATGQFGSFGTNDDFGYYDDGLARELFFEKFAETRKKNKFEGRILDIDKSLCKNAISNLKPFDSGGYGHVYLVRPKNKTEMSMVIKRIQCKDDGDKLRSATCEMLAARLMHFGIVPLWAWAEDSAEKTFYFVMPYLENETLAEKLQKDKKAIDNNQQGKGILHKQERLRILYQVACALAFLHEEIPNFRSSYIHRDVTSRNIVLDSELNARLLDFGLAREYTPGKDGVTLGTADLMGAPGYFPTGRPKTLTVGQDVFNFGIVILEVLSSFPPCWGEHHEFELRKKLKTGHFLEDNEKHIKFVWGAYQIKNGKAVDNKPVKCLENIATKCHEETISSAEIRTELEKPLRDYAVWKDPQQKPQEKRCVICLINPVDPDAQTILDHPDKCKLHVCAACMRNSYLNPIECHSCGKTVQPTIGHKWEAILLAGNDVQDKETANIFKRDLDKVSKAITSRHPMTMGISKERVHCVYADEPGTSQLLLPKLEERFNHVATQEFHSLLFYFTGHHGRKNGFKLGDDEEYLTSKNLETMIKEVVKKSGCKRVFVLLDCCEAPDIELKLPCSYYQINSCNMTQTTKFPKGEGSLMTEFFVQSLKGQSSRDPCLLQRKQERPCQLCEKYKSDNGFIKIDSLHENVEKHVQEYDKHVKNLKHDIPLHFRGSGWKDAVIAYFIDSLVTFEFTLQHTGSSDAPHEVVNQLPDTHKDLEKRLFIAYREKFMLPKLKPEDFSDMLAITFLTGPRHSNKHELNTLEMIEAAWNGKRQLCVSLREIKNLHNGKVGVFVDLHGASAVLEYLDNEDVKTLCQKNDSTIVVRSSLEDDGARELWRCVKEFANKPGSDKILSHLEGLLQINRDNEKIEKKGNLVFTFPLEDEDGKQITNFYSIHVEPEITPTKKPRLDQKKKMEENSMQATMTSLLDIMKKTGPLLQPLRLLVAAVAEPYTYAPEKQLLRLTLCDATAMCKAVVFDAKKFPMFKENNGVVLHNAVLNKNREVEVTSQTRVFISMAPEVPTDLLLSAIEVIRPTTPDIVPIDTAKRSPAKQRTSIQGKIVNDSVATTVMVNGKEVNVRDITVEDFTGKVKVGLWRNIAAEPVVLGDVVAITNVVVNRHNNEDSLWSTQFTKIKVTDVPNTEMTATILGLELGDVESSLLTEQDGIFNVSNEVLVTAFQCQLEDITAKLPKKLNFIAKGHYVVTINE